MFHLKSPLPLCRHAHGCKKKKIVLVGYTIVILGTTNISHASPYNCYIRHHSCSIKSTIVWINDLFSMILFLTGSVRQSVGRTRTNVTTHRRVSSSIRSVEHDWESIAHESVAVVVATEVELVGRAVELQKCKICSSEIFYDFIFNWLCPSVGRSNTNKCHNSPKSLIFHQIRWARLGVHRTRIRRCSRRHWGWIGRPGGGTAKVQNMQQWNKSRKFIYNMFHCKQQFFNFFTKIPLKTTATFPTRPRGSD